MLILKKTLELAGLSQAALARGVGVSTGTIAQVINHNQWPRRKDLLSLRHNIGAWLQAHMISEETIEKSFGVEQRHGNAAVPDESQKTIISPEEDSDMLLRRQTFTPAARKAFHVTRDPFADLQSAKEMWVSKEIRYVREAMFQVAKHGGFLAVVGESGSGKSTLRRDLVHRIASESHPIIIIEPYVIAAEETDRKGKTLKSTHIAEALLQAVAPNERIKASPQARFAQLHNALKDSHKAGYRHCLVIEEAHSMPIATLKHLKRIMELETGFTKLVNVILIGQPELNIKLSERNADVREVVQRCELVQLLPINPQTLHSFLEFRFGCVDMQVVDDTAIDAMVTRLVSKDGSSQLYPLALGNFVTAAMNLAAQVGEPRVTAGVVQGV
jgi:type II secretory pathway predicted ATPase ExeA/DNA-binding XRE family transcriptional regulator